MNKNETLEFLRDLIRFPSNSRDAGAQRDIQRMIADRLTTLDGRLSVSHQLELEHPWTLISTRGTAGPMLVFACHVDTVPTGDEGLWNHHPFGAVVSEDRVHGRGTVDMKGGVAAAAAALLAAAEAGRNVGLLLTADEEVGSLGAPGAAQALLGADVGAVIIPEATENRVVMGHRGALWLQLEALGLAAHGSTPERGINAALKISRALERAIDGLPLAGDPQLGRESWNLGILSSGTAPNIVPELAQATIDMRTVTDGTALRQWWESQPEVDRVETLLELPPLRTGASAWIDALPAELAPDPAAYFTDGSVIAATLPGIPVIIWGPGEPSQMHARNESLTIASLELAYDQFVEVGSGWNG